MLSFTATGLFVGERCYFSPFGTFTASKLLLAQMPFDKYSEVVIYDIPLFMA